MYRCPRGGALKTEFLAIARAILYERRAAAAASHFLSAFHDDGEARMLYPARNPRYV